jgi:hypothetical protein
MGAREVWRREDREKLNRRRFIRDRAPVNPMRQKKDRRCKPRVAKVLFIS